MADGVFYGGQPLTLDFNQAAATFVARRWPASRWPTSCNRLDGPLHANPFANRSIGSRFTLPYPDVPEPRLNEVIIPTGASRYGRGLFLIGGDQLDALQGSSDASEVGSSISSDVEFLPLVIEYDGGRFEWQMAKLTPVLLDATGSQSLWLLPLVDRRYFWRQVPANSLMPRGSTWSTLFSSLGDAIGLALDAGTVDSAHGYPDIETFADAGISAAQAIDAAALSLGLRAVMTSPGSALELQPATDANTALAANLAAATPWCGGEFEQDRLPEKVALVSRKAFDLYGLYPETVITEAIIDAEIASPASVIVHTPRWLEHYDGEEDAASRAKLDALAEKIAEDVASWGNKQHTLSIPGVSEWAISGHDDYLAAYVPGIDKTESVSTHVASLPLDFFPAVHLGNVDYRLNFSRVRGVAVSAASPGQDIEIQTLVGMDGTTEGIVRTLTVENTHDWDVPAGATVRAEYNATLGVWEAYQVDCGPPGSGG